jgi:nucleotide-binding universal stress UspA family protein
MRSHDARHAIALHSASLMLARGFALAGVTLMYDRILIPVDGSAYGEEVFPHALGIARATGVRLSLVRFIGSAAEHAVAAQQLGALAASVSGDARALVAPGDIADAIIEEARRVPRTLIVMTSHGRSGLMEAMLGSVALRVVRHAGQPVVVHRPRGESSGTPHEPMPIQSVVLPLDGSQVSEVMIQEAATFARWIGADVTVVTAITTAPQPGRDTPRDDTLASSFLRSRADGIAARYGVRTSWEVLHGEPSESIARFVENRRGAMLAMTTHGRPPLESAILGSVTAGCLRKGGVPVLTRLP